MTKWPTQDPGWDTLQSSVRGGYARGSTPYTLYTILTQKVRLHVSYILN